MAALTVYEDNKWSATFHMRKSASERCNKSKTGPQKVLAKANFKNLGLWYMHVSDNTGGEILVDADFFSDEESTPLHQNRIHQAVEIYFKTVTSHQD